MADTPKNDATDSAPENPFVDSTPGFTTRISGLTAQWDEETSVGTAPEDKLAEFAKKWQQQTTSEATDSVQSSTLTKRYDEAEELPPVLNAEEYVRPRRSLFDWGIAQWASVLMVILALFAFGIGLYLLPGLNEQTQSVAVVPTAIPAPPAATITTVTATNLTPTVVPSSATAAPIVPTQPAATQDIPTATSAVTPTPAPIVLPNTTPVATATYEPVIATLIAENSNNIPTPSPSANITRTVVAGETLYKVQEGDTLGKIAVKFKVDPDILAGYNKLTNADVLRIDQTLRIPPPTFTPAISTATKKP